MGRGEREITAKEEEPFLVTHRGKFYDIGDFLARHPGGRAHVEPYRGRSITALLRSGVHGGGSDSLLPAHSEAARYLLQGYRLQNPPDPQEEFKLPKVNGLNGVHKRKEDQGGDSQEEDVEDLESLVDWSQPMANQVGALGANYDRWVNSPVERRLRLFDSPVLEVLSTAKWYMIPIVWVPVIYMFLNIHYSVGGTDSGTAVGIVLGLVFWTLLEYTLHRWLFHMDPPHDSPRLIRLHFILHGSHHKVPFDNQRLVFPPTASAIIAIILVTVFKILLPIYLVYSIAAGTTMGYVTYDMVHYYLHFGAPKENSYLYFLKRYHNQHHFKHHEIGFGITNMFWDKLFGTKILLKKLAKAIKW